MNEEPISDARLSELHQQVERHRDYWPTEADLERAFDISAELDEHMRSKGYEQHDSLPPFTPNELRDICRDVFAARELLAEVERLRAEKRSL